MITILLHIISAVCGLAVSVIMVWKLTQFPDSFSFTERLGMGMVGGGMILRLGPILSKPYSTPFDDWATSVMQIGVLLMTWGRLARLIRHARSNTRAIDAAAAHLKARGKL
jgi:divalent metal cation (Fe/Co/Zn/Cd) transporter